MSDRERHFDWPRLGLMPEAGAVVVDAQRRLGLLLGCFIVLMALVLLRAAVFEATAGEEWRRGIDLDRSAVELLAAPRGRLLSRDGRVLAHDEMLLALAVEYRYLEEPLDEAWLRRQAWQRLGGRARSPQARAAETNRLRVEILDLRRRLTRLCGLTSEIWQRRASRIQRRVEAVAERVNGFRERQYLSRVANQAAGGVENGDDSWSTVFRGALLELFTPPPETLPSGIEVREEREHHVMARGLSLAMAAEIEANPGRFPGVRIERMTRRAYPQGSLAAQVIGYVGAAESLSNSADRDSDQLPGSDVIPGGRVGHSGAEAAAETWLGGRAGRRRRNFDSRGREKSTVVERAPRPGRDVVLTLDVEMQRISEQLLDEFQRTRSQSTAGQRPFTGSPGGAIVVLDTRNGAVLAAASAPRFDPNVFVGGESEEIARLLSDPYCPLLDRTAQMALPPGSVFKTVTAIALLQSENFDPEKTLHCRGYLREPGAQRCLIYRRYGVGHGPVALGDALARSCNVYFYHHATGLGPASLVAWAARLGLGQPTGCDWCGETSGRLLTPSEVRRKGQTWRDVDTQSTAIGQGRLATSPLQIARLMAVVANGGRIVTPHVLKDLGLPGEEGGTARSDDAELKFPVTQSQEVPGLRKETLARLRQGLEAVVADEHGTAHEALGNLRVRVAGKTGTAETGAGQADHAWFAGYAPADQPRLAFAVALEHAGNSAAATAIVGKLIEQLERAGHFGRRASPQRVVDGAWKGETTTIAR